jgi:putative flippase GtrA
MGFVKYVVVGLIAWLVDVAIFQLLWPVTGIAGSQALARIAGAITAFSLNRKHTFGVAAGSGKIGVQGFKYGVLLTLNWAATVALIFVFYRGLGIEPLWSKIITDVIVVPCNYWVMKYWIFPRVMSEQQKIEQEICDR